MSYNTLAATDLPQATTAEQEQSQAWLDAAQQYLDAVYSEKYPGVLESIDITVQANLWPRIASDGGVLYDANKRELSGIPAPILAAELAAAKLLEGGNTLLPTDVATATSASTQNSQLIEETVKAGSVQSTQRWSPSSTTTTTGASTQTLSSMGLPIIASIEAIMWPIIRNAASGSNYYINRA